MQEKPMCIYKHNILNTTTIFKTQNIIYKVTYVLNLNFYEQSTEGFIFLKSLGGKLYIGRLFQKNILEAVYLDCSPKTTER